MPRPDWLTERQERAAIAMADYCRAVQKRPHTPVLSMLPIRHATAQQLARDLRKHLRAGAGVPPRSHRGVCC
jgi:hypothetical protein